MLLVSSSTIRSVRCPSEAVESVMLILVRRPRKPALLRASSGNVGMTTRSQCAAVHGLIVYVLVGNHIYNPSPLMQKRLVMPAKSPPMTPQLCLMILFILNMYKLLSASFTIADQSSSGCGILTVQPRSGTCRPR